MPVTARTAKRHYKISPSVQRLLVRYPLLAIETEQDYARASDLLRELFGRDDLTADQQRYCTSLATLVEKYESDNDAPDFDRSLAPVQLLRHLMEANDMSVTELGKVVGTQALASMILAGSRRISLNNAKKLAKHFRLSVEAFI